MGVCNPTPFCPSFSFFPLNSIFKARLQTKPPTPSKPLFSLILHLSLSPSLSPSPPPHVVDPLLALRGHGGSSGVAPVGDGVQHPGQVAAGLAGVRRVPARQDVLQALRDHAVLVAGNVDEVTAQRLELGMGERRWMERDTQTEDTQTNRQTD